MYGAILGDIIGSPYEFDQGDKTKDFPLFSPESHFTDDSVMTIAVADALMSSPDDPAAIRKALIESMHEWGHKYPHAGYGGRFSVWLERRDTEPYNSFGNGSAMRVSSAGLLYNTLEKTREVARLTAEVTHNHPEGIKGAEATASAIFLARTVPRELSARYTPVVYRDDCPRGTLAARQKDEIKTFIETEFGYDLSRTCDEIRPHYHHVESCQETVPEAITAFLEGTDFEDVIRTAVSLGGDCDTLTCIAGGIAEAFYGIDSHLKQECESRLPEDMLAVLKRFNRTVHK